MHAISLGHGSSSMFGVRPGSGASNTESGRLMFKLENGNTGLWKTQYQRCTVDRAPAQVGSRQAVTRRARFAYLTNSLAGWMHGGGI